HQIALDYLHDIRDLAVGQPMPDLQGEDVAGQKSKLSDFRGKVVLLDVGATWCAPCNALIPHERELLERLKGKPFVMVSVSCDEKKDAVTQFVAKEPMPWTLWWDGHSGPIVKALHLRDYPTLFVIDAKGTIRYRGVRQDQVDGTVEKLLK